MTTLEVLEKARALIENWERWTQCEYARDTRGRRVRPRSPLAVRWCAEGAVYAATTEQSTADDAFAALEQNRSVCLPVVNDQDGHAAVLALYDAAIRNLRS